MTGKTVNVLSISWAGETAKKLAGKILNVIAVYQVGKWQVLCPFPYNVFTVYPPRTLALISSMKTVQGEHPLARMLRIVFLAFSIWELTDC